MAYANRYEQAIDGILVTALGGVVLVRDGHTWWLVDAAQWDAAQTKLEAAAPLEDDDGSGGAEAYGELCTATHAGAVAAIDGGSTHGPREAQLELVRRALAAGLIEHDTAQSMGLGA